MDVQTATPTAPMTAHDAAAASFADSPSATPEPTPVSTPAPAAATEPSSSAPAVDPVTATTTPSPDPGTPPQWRWQEILKTQREKAALEAETRVRQELGWTSDLPATDRATAQKAIEFEQWLRRDPVAASEWLANEVAHRHPRPAADPQPEPDREAGDGTLLYSAAQLEKLRAWDQRQLLASVRKELQPIQQDHQARTAREAQAELRTKAQQALATLQLRPHFKEHQADIRALMVADPQLSVESAYAQILTEKVIPRLTQHQEGAVLATLQQRAVASTLNPSSAIATTPGSLIGNARAAAEFAFRDG